METGTPVVGVRILFRTPCRVRKHRGVLVLNLRISDLDIARVCFGAIGKGDKERLVPIGRKAMPRGGLPGRRAAQTLRWGAPRPTIMCSS